MVFSFTRTFKRFILVLMLPLLFMSSSCKKAIEEQKKNIVINAITTGHWIVELYKQDSTDITPAFSGYEFQFYENGNVDGIKNTVTTSGTWSTDIPNYTITATFKGTPGDTLSLLNHTWKITDSYLDYVEAVTSNGAGTNSLHLRKK